MAHKLLLPLVLVVTVAASVAAQPSAPFVFSNNFWVNLHQHLFAEAGRAGRSGRSGGAGRSGGPGGSDVYAGLATRNPVFDAQLVAINDALGRMPGDAASVTDEAIDTTNDGPAGCAAHTTIAPGGRGAEVEMGLETIFH